MVGRKLQHYKYIDEYCASQCFWGTEPSKYVKLLVNYLSNNLKDKKILDLGAGEGKNAVYLATFGADIIAVDTSKEALERFNLQPNYLKYSNKITKLKQDIEKMIFKINTFDIIIAYGILHCLKNKKAIFNIIKNIRKSLKFQGYFVGCTFNNEVPPPKIQPYLSEKSYLDKGELRRIFDDWEILFYEDAIITEIHPTSKKIHNHSLSRIIAKKI